MSRLGWYWHRLRAMEPAEVTGRAKRKWFELIDARPKRDWASVTLKPGATYPQLPSPDGAPELLRKALPHDVEDILSGRWRAFGHLPICVSDPPAWHKDYLAGVDVPAKQAGFKLNHRELPGGADIKLIWELSRWHSLTRLAVAARVLGDGRAAWKCVRWLEHWAQHNRPYCGWNWTSALEAGMRLIQFTWIDGLLQGFGAAGEGAAELEKLRYEILPAHVWYTWRHKTAGSSANNHLLGELAGLILAAVRWPEVTVWGASLDELQSRWEREVLAQFAEDGGNREQALNYHLFSFELCWHTRNALKAADRPLSPAVEERLALATGFFTNAQVAADPWPYGDSDDAFVLPIAARTEHTSTEWWEWGQGRAGAIRWFTGEPPKSAGRFEEFPEGWRVFRQSGIAINRTGKWVLRWDGSPLGYLRTAAHGYVDALHVSIWVGDIAMVVDPGTGAYYADSRLRVWLASRAAHNGPAPLNGEPRRQGPFLWSEHHAAPRIVAGKANGVSVELPLRNGGCMRRTIRRSGAEDAWVIEDEMVGEVSHRGFTVFWQFAPETLCEEVGPRRFRVVRRGQAIEVRVSPDWETVDLTAVRPGTAGGFAGIVSPHFRQTAWAPYLRLAARAEGNRPCVFQTVILASHH